MMPDSPYAIIAISALFLLLYGLTLVFSRIGMFSKASQRKFWNVLLLLALTGSGLLGILLAVTVNFKISLPITDRLLVWHVDFGIALFIISIFHFTWHARYYLDLLKKGRRAESRGDQNPEIVFDGEQPGLSDIPWQILPFLLGFTTMATQLTLLREFMSVFTGNELVIGVVLATWMLLTGLGALAGRKTKMLNLKGIIISLFILALIPFVILFLLDSTRNIVLPVGGMPGLSYMLIASVILLAPFCLLSGWLFSSLSGLLSGLTGKNPISTTYGWETIGSIASGLLSSMVLVYIFEPFQAFSLVLLINGVVLYLAFRRHQPASRLLLYPGVSIILVLTVFIFRIDRTALQFLFKGQEIVTYNDTPYGKLVVTQNAGQLNFFENNSLLFTTNNTITNEEMVHYALLQRADTGNLLVIGGSISGVADECLKYPLKRVDIMEINPRIIDLGKEFRRFPQDKRLQILVGDPCLLVNKVAKMVKTDAPGFHQPGKAIESIEYDAVLLNVPEPSTLQLNRFYSVEFFERVKLLLFKNGIVSLSLAATSDYVGSDAVKIQSTVYQTLKSVFGNVLVIQGEKNYFIASDGLLTPEVAGISAKRNIHTEYVNEYYLDDASLKERSADIIHSISVPAKVNRDFNPIGCYRQYGYWLSYAGTGSLGFLVIPLVLMIIIGVFLSNNTTVKLFMAGFTSFVIEIMLLMILQVVYGYIYVLTGIFITLFMAGLAGGVFWGKLIKSGSGKLLRVLSLISSGIPLLVLLLLFLVDRYTIHPVVLMILFGLLNAGVAFLTGYIFHVASVLRGGGIREIASANYSADLLGSASGALIINAWMVPVFGFYISLAATAGISVLSLAGNFIRKK